MTTTPQDDYQAKRIEAAANSLKNAIATMNSGKPGFDLSDQQVAEAMLQAADAVPKPTTQGNFMENDLVFITKHSKAPVVIYTQEDGSTRTYQFDKESYNKSGMVLIFGPWNDVWDSKND